MSYFIIRLERFGDIIDLAAKQISQDSHGVKIYLMPGMNNKLSLRSHGYDPIANELKITHGQWLDKLNHIREKDNPHYKFTQELKRP